MQIEVMLALPASVRCRLRGKELLKVRNGFASRFVLMDGSTRSEGDRSYRNGMSSTLPDARYLSMQSCWLIKQQGSFPLKAAMQLNQCWPFLPLTSFIPLGHGDSEVRSY